MAQNAQQGGCLHHRFGVGDGFVLIIDEWESPEHFQRFFEGNEQVATAFREGGAQGDPEITFMDAVTSADQF